MEITKSYIIQALSYFVASIILVIAATMINMDIHYKELILLLSGVFLGVFASMFVIADLVLRKKITITETADKPNEK